MAAVTSKQYSSAPNSDSGRISAARRRRSLFVFPRLKVANFALFYQFAKLKI